MAGIPSIGDLLMLSQLAWKIGRAFTKGRKGAPSEFLEVESECKGLTTALKLVAECLLADRTNILYQADQSTTSSVGIILNSCERTLKDLESLLQQYQTLRTYKTNAGTATETGWSDLVLHSWKTMMWTSEGGNIQALRNMLNMHTQTITITLQALQSKSLARLQATVSPMAEKIDDVHNAVTGELGMKIDEVHRVVMSIAGGVPIARPRQIQRELEESLIDFDDRNNRLIDAPPTRTSSLDRIPSLTNSFDQMLVQRPNNDSNQTLETIRHQTITSPTHEYLRDFIGSDTSSIGSGRRVSNVTTSTVSSYNPRESHSSECLPNPPIIGSPTLSNYTAPTESNRGSTFSQAMSDPGYRNSGYPFPQTSLLDSPLEEQEEHRPTPPPKSPRREQGPTHQSSIRWSPFPRPPTPSKSAPTSPYMMPPLPPPAIDDPNMPTPLRTKRSLNAESAPIPVDDVPELVEDSPEDTDAITADEHEAFERALFRNSAILCDLRGKLVEYAAPVDEENRPHEVEMKDATKDCRICVVRKRETLPSGKVHLTMAIYSFGDDRRVRLQQRLKDGDGIIPYPSYFSPEKISISIPTELRFLDGTYGHPPTKTVTTNWINYVFHDAISSTQFQNVLYGRNLLCSYKTEKTLRLHEGLAGAFTYQEQMCAMENLRLWEDEATNGILAMIHFSAHFRPGYLTFWINDSSYPIRAKDEGGKCVKVKGLRVSADKNARPVKPAAAPQAGNRPGTAGRGALERRNTVGAPDGKENTSKGKEKVDGRKWITGARIEFASEGEKTQFLAMVKEVQRTMIQLPEL